MRTIGTRTELFKHLKELNIPQRQDSLSEQAADMVSVYEALGMFTISSLICQNFKVSNESTHYKHITDNIKLSVDLEDFSEEGKGFIQVNAISLANLFGCYDLADFLR